MMRDAGTAYAEGGAVKLDLSHVLNPELGKQIPVNRERAREVLEELGLDGLIALQPHNVYYLTNTVTTLTRFIVEYPAFATFPKDPAEPSFLVSTTGNSWEIANGDRDVPEVIAMSGASNWRDYIGATPEQMRVEPEAFKPRTPIAADANLTRREAGWKQAQERNQQSSAATAEWALVHALKRSGLINGRIAVDDMRVAYLLEKIGIDTVTIVPGDNVFRRIRQVKTDHEVALLRVAQRITQESAMAAARSMEEGMTYEEIRLRFFAEGAARGGDGNFLLLGVTQGLLPDGVVKRGRSYMLDCSIRFKNYQGDFARTISVGEPTAEALKRFKAQQAGREAAFELIKAGVKFNVVEQAARDAAVKAGMPKELPVFGMHSVGLQHGDDPNRTDVPFPVGEELTLEENMVVTLDLPYVEIGWGAGHNEDLLRITKTGYEILNDPGDPLVVV